MSNYLYRLARFAFRRRRLVLAAWLVAAIAAIAIAVASGGKTNDSFTIPGTEAQNAAQVLAARLPAFSGGQSTVVFATAGGSAKVTDPAARAAIETAMSKLRAVPQVSAVVDPFQARQVSPSGQVALRQVQWSAPASEVTDASLNDVKAAMKPVQADGVQEPPRPRSPSRC
ncbi:MAG: MMPL family transporter [Streptosporangiaceae bacterium]